MRKSKRINGDSADDDIDDVSTVAKEQVRQRRFKQSPRGSIERDAIGKTAHAWWQSGPPSRDRQFDKIGLHRSQNSNQLHTLDSRRFDESYQQRRSYHRHLLEGYLPLPTRETGEKLGSASDSSYELVVPRAHAPSRMTSGAYGFGDVSNERTEAAAAEEADGYRSSFVEQTDSCYELELIPEESSETKRQGINWSSSSELNDKFLRRDRESLDRYRFDTH